MFLGGLSVFEVYTVVLIWTGWGNGVLWWEDGWRFVTRLGFLFRKESWPAKVVAISGCYIF